jgi:hypothetical protein
VRAAAGAALFRFVRPANMSYSVIVMFKKRHWDPVPRDVYTEPLLLPENMFDISSCSSDSEGVSRLCPLPSVAGHAEQQQAESGEDEGGGLGDRIDRAADEVEVEHIRLVVNTVESVDANRVRARRQS